MRKVSFRRKINGEYTGDIITGIMMAEALMEGTTHYYIEDLEFDQDGNKDLYLVHAKDITKLHKWEPENIVVENPINIHNGTFYLYDYKEQKYFSGSPNNLDWSDEIADRTLMTEDNARLFLAIFQGAIGKEFIELRDTINE